MRFDTREGKSSRKCSLLPGKMVLAGLLSLGGLMALGTLGSGAQGEVRPIVRGGLIVKVITKGRTPIRTEPDLSAPVACYKEAFRPLFVFDSSDEGVGRLKRNGFYRVSTTDVARNILGWAHEEDVVEWDHRECAVFTPQMGRQLARIYLSYEDLRQALSLPADADHLAVSREPAGLDNVAGRCKFALPILETREWLERNIQHTAYRVAYLEAPIHYSPASREDIAQHCGTADVMFVIDATISMEPYIRAVREAVRQLSATLTQRRSRLTFRLGLVAFRDYYPPNPEVMEYVVRRFVDLTSDYEEFLRGLAEVREAALSTLDCREAVFDGLYEAVANTEWSDLALHVVVLIGDNSGREASDPLNRYQRSLEQVLELAAERAVRFLCLKIEGPCNENEDQERHRQQLRRLAEGTGPETRGLYVEVPLGVRQIDHYAQELLAFMDHEVTLAEQRLEACISILEGRPLERSDLLTDGDWTIILETLPSGLRDPQPVEGPRFSTGWILQRVYGEVRNVEPCAMITATEFALYLWMLNNVLLTSTGAVPDVSDVLVIMGSTYQRLTGESMDLREDEPLAQFLNRKHGLPVRNIGMLGRTLDAIRTLDESQRAELTRYVKDKVTALHVFEMNSGNRITLEGNFQVMLVPLRLLP